MVFGDFDRREPVHPDVPKRTGKMYNVEKFDAGCFGRLLSKCQQLVRMDQEKINYETSR